MEDWLRALVDPSIKICGAEKIFGSKSPNHIINRTVIAIIQTIYKNRQRKKRPR